MKNSKLILSTIISTITMIGIMNLKTLDSTECSKILETMASIVSIARIIFPLSILYNLFIIIKQFKTKETLIKEVIISDISIIAYWFICVAVIFIGTILKESDKLGEIITILLVMFPLAMVKFIATMKKYGCDQEWNKQLNKKLI